MLPNIEANKSVRFCLLPEGQDPDDFLNNYGASKMQELVANSTPLIYLLWKRETEGKIFDSPERKSALDKSLRDIIRRIKDRELRKHYGSEFASLRSNLFFGTNRKGLSAFDKKVYKGMVNKGLSF